MAWASRIIPNGNRRMMPQKRRAAVADLGDLITWIRRFDVRPLKNTRQKGTGPVARLRGGHPPGTKYDESREVFAF